ncbi:MAG: hypothetical protein ABI723_11315 [Bacteroidia bacterium]
MKLRVYLILTTLLSCNYSKQKEEIKNADISTNNTEGLFLIGKWVMCAEGSLDGSTTHYNVCPQIIFNSDRTANYLTGETLRETIRWKVEKDTLFATHLYFGNNDTTERFPGYKYIIVKKEDANSIDLELKQIEKKYIMYLGRQKSKSEIPSFK